MMIDFLDLRSKPPYDGPRFTYRDQMPASKKQHATEMRRNPTLAEAELWSKLRKEPRQPRRFGIWKRQRAIFGYIADFWNARAGLIIEVDGPYHESRVAADGKRDAVLAERGIRTLRFTNDQVLNDIDSVLEAIVSAVAIDRSVGPIHHSWKDK